MAQLRNRYRVGFQLRPVRTGELLIQNYWDSCCEAVLSLDQNGIETVLSSKESVDDVEHIAYTQSVHAKIMNMYTDTNTEETLYK